MSDCLFCKLVKGDIPSYPIWQDDKFIAILDKFPVVPGQVLVISKRHFGSYFASLSDSILKDLIVATKTVAKLMDQKLTNSIRTCLVFEGFEIDHIHAKLYPSFGKKSLSILLKQPTIKLDDDTLEKLRQKFN